MVTTPDTTETDAAAPGAGGQSRPGRLASTVERHSNLIAAVLTILAAVLSILLVFVSADRSEAQADADGLEQQVGALKTSVELRDGTIQALKDANSKLTEEIGTKERRIAELESQLQEEGVPAAPTGTPAVRHRGQVALAYGGDAIDFNAPKTDPRWGATSDDRNASGYIYLDQGNISHPGADQLLYLNDMSSAVLRGEAASYATCSGATTYAPVGSMEPADLERPNTCFRSEEGRLGTIRLVDEEPERVTLDITTWELPD